MTVPVQVPLVSYTGNGVTAGPFTFPFRILSADDLKVSLDGVLTTAYTVSGIGDDQGALAFNVAPATGVVIIIYRQVELERANDYQYNGDLRADTVNADFDRLWMAIQDVGDLSTRSIQYPVSEYGTDGTLPGPQQRARMMLGFDETGRQTLIPVSASVGAGDLRDEIGSDGKAGFVAGIDFAPGTTKSLTLSRAPGSVGNVLVFFDGAFQGNDQIQSLVGNVLTFTTPIPSGVQRVYVRTGTTLSLSLPGMGSVADAMVAIGSKLYNRIHDSTSVRDFGVVGDGAVDDTAAMQAALDAGVPLRIPDGFWMKITAPLKYHRQTVLIGSNAYCCGFIANGSFAIFVNHPSDIGDFYGGLFRGFTVRFGTIGFSITPYDDNTNPLAPIVGVQSLCIWEDIRFENQTVRGLSCSQLFLVNTLRNVVFFYCGGGFYGGRETNLNIFDCCRWEGLTDTHVYLDTTAASNIGGEANLFLNPRHEAIPDGSPDLSTKNVYVLNKCYSTKISTGYFENTFQNILYGVGGDSPIFENCRFTGQALNNAAPAGTFKREIFNSEMPVTFLGGNQFATGSDGNVLGGNIPVGLNQGLEVRKATCFAAYSQTGQNERFTTKSLPINSGEIHPVVTFTRSDLSNALTNNQSISAEVTVKVNGARTDGASFSFVRKYLMSVQGFANSAPTATLTQIAAADANAVSAALTVNTSTTSTAATLNAGVTLASMSYANLQVTVDYSQDGSKVNGQFTRTINF